jgi:GDP-mannose 6-dehydrogenase
MRISVFGLGYVGAVTAGCLAGQGHQVVGVDVHPQKVEAFNRGEPPIIEPGLSELLQRAASSGLLQATHNCEKAIAATDLSIICVGTPSAQTGALDLSHVRGVTLQIAEVLRHTGKRHVIVFRSTMLPGSTASLCEELLGDLANRVDVFYFLNFSGKEAPSPIFRILPWSLWARERESVRPMN